jgi:hypothetical protein
MKILRFVFSLGEIVSEWLLTQKRTRVYAAQKLVRLDAKNRHIYTTSASYVKN